MTDTIIKKHGFLFKTGVVFIVFWSIVIGVLHIGVLYILGLPLVGLLIGIILVWCADETNKSRLTATVLPVFIVPSAFFLFLQTIPKAEPETFLLAQNFRGQFEIVFDEPCGQPFVYENQRRIYRIPGDGVLIVSGARTTGIIDRKFYSADENGVQTQLLEFHWSKFAEEQADWHWMFSKIALSKDLVGVFWAYRRRFSYIVSDYLSAEAEDRETREEKQKIFDQTVAAALQDCRRTQ